MTIASYLRHQHRFEVLLLVALVVLSCVFNVAVELIDHGRLGEPFSGWLPWILEGTSSAALLIMFPALLWFERRYPLQVATWQSALPAHVAFSVVFSVGHVLLMYLARQRLFPWLLDQQYLWASWASEFFYEYLKDVRTYFFLLALVYLYRFVLRRLRGEAGFVSAGDEPTAVPSPDRFLVKKLGREFLVRTQDIDWIESAGNYVNLHVGPRVYPLRGTMAQTAQRLEEQGFARVHRQAILNLDRVALIEVYESGQAQLTTAATEPISRRYRAELRQHLGVTTDAGRQH